MSERNIVLVGFMGSGKTSVGREVAARLGRPFIDLDDLIATRAGKPVAAIFAEDGEPAFRALERALCREMGEPQGLVIAAGGGAVLDAGNRSALSTGGLLVCLDAGPETLLGRLDGEDERPLLAGGNRLARIKTLLAERAEAYAAVPHHVATDGLTVAECAAQVIALVTAEPRDRHHPSSGSHTLNVQGEYEVLIRPGVLPETGDLLAAYGIAAKRCAVVTNPRVAGHHLETLRRALVRAGTDPLIFEVPEGEAYKTLQTVAGLYERFAGARLGRDEPVLALGGGVIGDMAGFVAATWLRGVPFVQIPTSLLAMVDASVGGKVAVDLSEGKNLVGAFKQPALVLIDPALLRTLPEAEYRAGMAEVLKHGLIADPGLFDDLLADGAPSQAGSPEALGDMIARAVEVKVNIVTRDPYENGERAWLNLGHTFGHALELLSGFTLRHGEAVGLGLIAAAELSLTLACCEPDLVTLVRRAVERLGLPSRRSFDIPAALAAMGNDKKRRAGGLRFVVIRRPGEVLLVDSVPEGAIRAALATIQAE